MKKHRSKTESEIRVHFYLRDIFLPDRAVMNLDEFLDKCRSRINKGGFCEIL